MKITFLGTGASGGTPGVGKSKRFESSLYIQDKTNILIDVTRNFFQQAATIKHIDYILLTHGHKDAIGGIPQLERWSKTKKSISVFAHEKTIRLIKKRYKRLTHYKFFAVKPNEQLTIDGLNIEALEVPHSRSKDFPTFAWKMTSGLKTIVYASDIASITPELTNFCQNIDVLIVDGAMWRKKLFTHLTIDVYLPDICGWKVKRIFLTQIGKSAFAHGRLAKEVHAFCPKALPAYDGLALNF